MSGVKDLQFLDGQPRRATAKPTRAGRLREEAKEERDRRLTRSQLRVKVYREDLGECRRCHLRVWLRLKDAPTVFLVANIHEWIAKSLGGDDLDPTNCLTLCGFCHPLFTEHRLEIVALDPARLMRGLVEFITGGNPLKGDRWRLQTGAELSAAPAAGGGSGRSCRTASSAAAATPTRPALAPADRAARRRSGARTGR